VSAVEAFDAVSPAALDYLQRAGLDPLEEVAGAARTSAPPELRRLIRVRAVSQAKKPEPPPESPEQPQERVRVPTESVLVGLSAYRIPLAFLIRGTPATIGVHLATWSALEREQAASGVLDGRLEVLEAVLRGAYPSVELESIETAAEAWPLGGLALGVPTVARPDPRDGGAAIDRLAAALAGLDWAALVLAEPVADELLLSVRHWVINELREVAAAEQAARAPSPLAKHYSKLLESELEALTEAQSTGAWRTAVYLLGDESSYPALASAWRAIFSGPRSLPEPVQVFDSQEAPPLAAGWAMPDLVGPPGPGGYRHPYACQSLLSSTQLAGFVQLPRLELPGFAVRIEPAFDVVPPSARADATVPIGRVIHRSRATSATFSVSTRALTRHAFVAGVTGAGKTNTILHLLEQLDSDGIPFLVVEPAKTEYRTLLNHPNIGGRLRVFTVGKESVSPLRLNPFEVPMGTPVSEHLDLLRAAFGASFGMWTPLPQVLEQCLHEVYRDRGWDLRTNKNTRLGDDDVSAAAFPTLSELIAKVDEVVPRLGYEERVMADIRAALITRLDSLRRGSKGAMLDVDRSLPIEELLEDPSVIELESLGDEGDKALLIALILIRMAEHRRATGQAGELVHLLVIEEAHRLLANVPTQTGEEMANPRGQAVETFTNLLSEIRAYGQGVLVADQVPVRLAPDSIKNTNLKIGHRIVAADDRATLGGAMAMDETQTRALTILSAGEAAVFSDGEDAPLLVQVPLLKDDLASELVTETHVAAHMAQWRAQQGTDTFFYPRAFCAETCTDAPEACATARWMVENESVRRVLARTILSMFDDAAALDRLWPDIVDVVRAHRPPTTEEDALFRAFAGHGADWYAQRRGARAAWTYAQTDQFGAALRAVLLEKAADRQNDGATSECRAALRRLEQQLVRRTYDPYQACSAICNQETPICRYRHAVGDLVTSGRYETVWQAADAADSASEDGARQQTWEVSQDAGYELIEFPEDEWTPELRERVTDSARRACLCFAQQMLAGDTRKVPRTVRRVLARVLAEAGL
jgi:Helicase HerA, central domain